MDGHMVLQPSNEKYFGEEYVPKIKQTKKPPKNKKATTLTRKETDTGKNKHREIEKEYEISDLKEGSQEYF